MSKPNSAQSNVTCWSRFLRCCLLLLLLPPLLLPMLLLLKVLLTLLLLLGLLLLLDLLRRVRLMLGCLYQGVRPKLSII